MLRSSTTSAWRQASPSALSLASSPLWDRRRCWGADGRLRHRWGLDVDPDKVPARKPVATWIWRVRGRKGQLLLLARAVSLYYEELVLAWPTHWLMEHEVVAIG